MEIKTKYNIGEKVWWIRDNQIRSGSVDFILFTATPTQPFYLGYGIHDEEFVNFKEYELFPTKEELLKSL